MYSITTPAQLQEVLQEIIQTDRWGAAVIALDVISKRMTYLDTLPSSEMTRLEILSLIDALHILPGIMTREFKGD